jgi:phosphoglycerate dehydrogenase-like enzyme
MAVSRLVVAGLALLVAEGACAADTAPADEVTVATVAALGLQESGTPVAERAGWRKPRRVIVRTGQERLSWLEDVAEGVELVPATTEEEAVAAAPGADALIGFCSAAILEAGPDIRWIQLPYAGAERCVALSAVRERDILVTNAQRIYGPEIAEHVLAMTLMFSRGLYRYYPEQQAGRWNRDAVPEERLWELGGKTMLVVGLGGIGTETARRAHALGMNVVATRGSRREGPAFVSYVGLADELPELAGRADVVVNATPLTPETRGLFDAEFFAGMKPTAYFINVGRGASVVTEDLVAALENGAIAGAGLDVTDPEPLPEGHPLWSLPNVIITPHVAAGSDVRVGRLWIVMRENLRRYAGGEKMLSVVDVERGY